MQVFINESAFWGLLVSAIEVYKKESYGLLLGHRDGDMFMVVNAIACQKAERHATWVKARDKSYARIVNFFENLPNLYIVGDFHSHPRHNTALSEDDLYGMSPGHVYIVMEIKDKAKDKYWSYNEDGTLSGTTDNWFIKIAAYYIDPDSYKHRMADVLCPFAIGFNIKPRTPSR
ncbi:MAG: Mov34/MPN/PAD-1 family protein [Candidatus Edwardsbacteria bacterium]|nr:Mov34/MPN/PAD-1 family protein [Candidatus Edwardsbacteria bacterium]